MKNTIVRFKAIGRRALVIPYVLTDDFGEVVVNKNITFSNGGKFEGKIVEAVYATSIEREINYLREFAENNPDYIKEYVSEEDRAVKKSKKSEPGPDENTGGVMTEGPVRGSEIESMASKKVDLETVESVKTLQDGILFLKGVDQSIKIGSLRKKEALLEKAKSMGFDFVNLN